jgi:ubiquinone/menaquinone biosynthesis C-methylase UbiE
MSVLKFIKKIFWYPTSTKANIEKYQERIRNVEWEAIKPYIPLGSSFLDVGCGAGYSLMKARTELECEIQGIDPVPGEHGVGRFMEDLWKQRPILHGSAENIPFLDSSFDVVYSSHVLEHVENEKTAILEMARVLKSDGRLIIGMPTASMAWLAFFSHFLFTTHINFLFLCKAFKYRDFKKRLSLLLIPRSHSYPRAKYIYYDLKHYRISNWKKIISHEFEVQHVLLPAFYPFPDFIQFFNLRKKFILSSSVFFICSKK